MRRRRRFMDIFKANLTCPIVSDDIVIHKEPVEPETSIYTQVWTTFMNECDKIKNNDLVLCSVNVVWSWGGDLSDKDDFYVHFINFIRDICEHKRGKMIMFFGRMYGLTYREISKKYGGGVSTYHDWMRLLCEQHPEIESVIKAKRVDKKYL
jgi:hypothetical protein